MSPASEIVVIDYGMGNLGSVKNMLAKIGAEAIISSDPDDIRKADRLILPGVGSFDCGMKQLQERGLVEPLRRKVIDHRTPILGICLGMQLFTEGSAEGRLKGLAWVPADTVFFDRNRLSLQSKVPHMGWNRTAVINRGSKYRDVLDGGRYYFVHSYHVTCRDSAHVLATANYGYDFVAAFECRNILGVQFHPEKSHQYGLKLLSRFVSKN